MRKKQNRFKRLGLAVIALYMLCVTGLQTYAADDSKVGVLYEVTADTEMKEAADAGSATVAEVQAGTAVVVESEDGAWSRVLYREQEGYVESDVLEIYAEEELESLAQEMGSVSEEEQRLVEEADLAARQNRSSIIWGSIIAVLILAIFGLGIVSAVKNAKEEEQEEENENRDKNKKAEDLVIEDMDEEEPPKENAEMQNTDAADRQSEETENPNN